MSVVGRTAWRTIGNVSQIAQFCYEQEQSEHTRAGNSWIQSKDFIGHSIEQWHVREGICCDVLMVGDLCRDFLT